MVLNPPMLKEEIIGKYTNEKIYKHEIFLKQKLDTQIVKEEKKIIDFEKSSYNMKFELFKNPNYALAQGEYINIISVYPEGVPDNKGRYPEFAVEFVAEDLKVLGFIRNGHHESQSITQQTVKKTIEKKVVEVVEEVKSDEIILDIDLDVLLRLTENYNKGNQLWMVKTAYRENKNQDEEQEEDKNEPTNTRSKNFDTTTQVNEIKHKFRMYTSNVSVLTQSATIDYSNDKNKEKSKMKNVEILVNSSETCSSIKDKFIVGNVNSFFIRTTPTKDSDNKTILYKNIIIPYIDKQEDWYKTCDGKYVHESVVREVDTTFIPNFSIEK